MRKVWMRAVLIALGTLAGLTLAEGIFVFFPRLLPAPVLLEHRWRHPTIKQPDEVFRMRYPPDFDFQVEGHPDYSFHIRTRSLGFESMGFRDDGIDPPVYGVVVGDSHTWGFGVEQEETFTELLEQTTSRDFVNLARAGDSSVELVRILESYGLSLDPRLAIWAFFENDLRGSKLFEGRIRHITRENIFARHQQEGSAPLRLDGEAGFAISAWVRLPALGSRECLGDPADLEGHWRFDSEEGPHRTTEGLPRFAVGAGESFTWTAWLTVEPSASELWFEIVSKRERGVGYHLTLRPDGHVKAGLADDAGNEWSSLSEDRIDDGHRHLVAGVFDRQRGRLTVWIDGRESGRALLGAVSEETGSSGSLRLASRRRSLPGSFHEISFYRSALKRSELLCLLREGGSRWEGTILSQEDVCGRGFQLSLDPEGRPVVQASDGTMESRVLADTPLTPERWTHVGASIALPSVSFFVDGRPAGGGALEVAPQEVSQPADIWLGQPRPFYGALDEVRIHGEPLTRSRAVALVSDPGPDPASSPLLAHWPLDDERCCRVKNRVGLNDGVALQANSTVGRSGGGLEFDGLTSGVEVPSPASMSEEEAAEESLLQRLLGGLWLYRLFRFTARAEEYEPYRAMQKSYNFQDRGVNVTIYPPQRSLIDPTRLVTDPILEEGWRITHEALSRAQELTRRHGVRLIVIVIPFKAQTYWHLVRESFSPEELEGANVDFISDLVREFCESRGIEVIDMTPIFRRRALAGEQLFFRYDSHINKEGHRIIAETLAERLRDVAAGSSETQVDDTDPKSSGHR